MDTNSFNYLKEQRDILQLVFKKYEKALNLYKKHYLEQKIKCYKDLHIKPDKYFQCIEVNENKMERGSQMLESKISQIEIEDEQCQKDCNQYFKSEDNKYNDQLIDCYKKCLKKQKDSVIGVYDQFFQSSIGQNKEYRQTK